MVFEGLESTIEQASVSVAEKSNGIGSWFKSAFEPENGSFSKFESGVEDSVSEWLDNESVKLEAVSATVCDSVKKMYSGTESATGSTLGLKEISEWKINPEYRTQNLKQHAGYAAEVISTTKENLISQYEKSGITTYRTDDRPDLYSKNDQYVDKIRVNDLTGEIEKVQTKFVGNDGASCLEKLASTKFDKYFNDGQVDKIEIPKDYYDQIKNENLIGEKIQSLSEQLERVQAEGKTEVAEKIQEKIDRYNKIDEMLDRSTVSSEEAQYAVEHPQRYAAKVFAQDLVKTSNREGVKTGLTAAAITACVSTVEDVQHVLSGDMTAGEAALDVMKDTGTAGALGYGTAFVSTAVAKTLSGSSHTLLQSVGNSALPAAAVSFVVESYDSVIDYAQGQIDAKELTHDLGKNAVGIAGSIAGSAAMGAAVGSLIPGAGTAVGFAAGLIGGIIGCTVASAAYESAFEAGWDGAEQFLEQAQTMADKTIEAAQEEVPDKVEDIRSAINDYAVTTNIPIHV